MGERPGEVSALPRGFVGFFVLRLREDYPFVVVRDAPARRRGFFAFEGDYWVNLFGVDIGSITFGEVGPATTVSS